jgi:hypothetical protein
LELLRSARETSAAELASTDGRAVRLLFGRLWDPDAEIRDRAARVLGRTAASKHDLGLEIIRRLMWALNDESATNGVHAVPALGEIGRQSPEMLRPFLSALASLAWDEGLRLELLRALTATAESAPHLVRPHLSELESFVDETHEDERDALERLRETVQRGSDDDQ